MWKTCGGDEEQRETVDWCEFFFPSVRRAARDCERDEVIFKGPAGTLASGTGPRCESDSLRPTPKCGGGVGIYVEGKEN